MTFRCVPSYDASAQWVSLVWSSVTFFIAKIRLLYKYKVVSILLYSVLLFYYVSFIRSQQMYMSQIERCCALLKLWCMHRLKLVVEAIFVMAQVTQFLSAFDSNFLSQFIIQKKSLYHTRRSRFRIVYTNCGW